MKGGEGTEGGKNKVASILLKSLHGLTTDRERETEFV